ncbi:MAG: hypothetical protein ACXVHS_10685, partial [Methanobacterium sp.]
MQSSPDILAKGDLVEVSKEELFKDPNVLNSDLLHAIDSNDENKVKEALHNGAKADFILTESHKPNWSGWSILAYTVYFNKINLTKIL